MTSTSHLRSFFFNDTATTEIYTLSLHDALPISAGTNFGQSGAFSGSRHSDGSASLARLSTSGRQVAIQKRDRKSTRLNSSHVEISYAVFCLKKKTNGKHHSLT